MQRRVSIPFDVKYDGVMANPDVLKYAATYVVFARIATGVVKFTCCHPDAVALPVYVACSSNVPVLLYSRPMYVPVLAAPL